MSTIKVMLGETSISFKSVQELRAFVMRLETNGNGHETPTYPLRLGPAVGTVSDEAIAEIKARAAARPKTGVNWDVITPKGKTCAHCNGPMPRERIKTGNRVGRHFKYCSDECSREGLEVIRERKRKSAIWRAYYQKNKKRIAARRAAARGAA